MIIIMITIMIDEEARTYAFQGVRQKLLSGFFLLRGWDTPPFRSAFWGTMTCRYGERGTLDYAEEKNS